MLGKLRSFAKSIRRFLNPRMCFLKTDDGTYQGSLKEGEAVAKLCGGSG